MKKNVIILLVPLIFYTEVSYSASPVPQGQSTFIDLSTPTSPVFSDNPADNRFLTTNINGSFKADIAIPEFDQPVDIYTFYIWSGTPGTAFSLGNNMSLTPVPVFDILNAISSGTNNTPTPPLFAGTHGPGNQTVLNLPREVVPPGSFTSHLFVTPAGGGLTEHHHYVNSFSITPPQSFPDSIHRACELEIEVLEDKASHKNFIGLSDRELCQADLPFPGNPFGPGSVEVIDFFTLNGEVEAGPIGPNGMPLPRFHATGMDTIAGFDNILIEIEGIVESGFERTANRRMTNCNLPDPADWNESIVGTLTIGGNGGLPTGQPIVYGFRLLMPLTTSNISGSADAGPAWLMLTADKDAVVNCNITSPSNSCSDDNEANTNFSDTATIVSRYNINPSFFDVSQSYFHFSLPELPPGTTIEQAHVTLYDVENLITPSQDSVPVGYALGPWNTDLITWNNQPNPYFDGPLNYSIRPFIEQFKWRGHPNSVADHINSIYSGTRANNGFILGKGAGHHSRGFRSVNTGFEAPRLYLQVNSPAGLNAANVNMPVPPPDMEIASQLFICEGSTPPEDTEFSVE